MVKGNLGIALMTTRRIGKTVMHDGCMECVCKLQHNLELHAGCRRFSGSNLAAARVLSLGPRRNRACSRTASFSFRQDVAVCVLRLIESPRHGRPDGLADGYSSTCTGCTQVSYRVKQARSSSPVANTVSVSLMSLWRPGRARRVRR